MLVNDLVCVVFMGTKWDKDKKQFFPTWIFSFPRLPTLPSRYSVLEKRISFHRCICLERWLKINWSNINSSVSAIFSLPRWFVYSYVNITLSWLQSLIISFRIESESTNSILYFQNRFAFSCKIQNYSQSLQRKNLLNFSWNFVIIYINFVENRHLPIHEVYWGLHCLVLH